MKVQSHFSLKSENSWLVGGAAEYFAAPDTVEELQELQSWAVEKSQPVTILADGSNVLISDRGIPGLTISMKRLDRSEVREVDDRLVIVAQAGVGKSFLLKTFLKYELTPAFFLAGIPGSVGGGVVMNAGVSEDFKPREFCEIVDAVEVLRKDNTIEKISSLKLKWSYRKCYGWQPGIITSVEVSWPLRKEKNVREAVKNANLVRLEKQPLTQPSYGSVFRNPGNLKAAQLIDSCGLKGLTIGAAQVSMKHANFIVNLGNASSNDIWQLIEKVKATVFERKGVSLETEVIRLGLWASLDKS